MEAENESLLSPATVVVLDALFEAWKFLQLLFTWLMPKLKTSS